MLDGELRLITPTDTTGIAAGDLQQTVKVSRTSDVPAETNPVSLQPSALNSQSSTFDSFFQLTHDYLVPSLRDWLTRKQKETRQGRAELTLAERSALWNATPLNRQLPSWWEYWNIRLLTRRNNWTQSQRAMMTKAGRLHGLRWTVALAVLMAVGIGVQRYVSSVRGYVAGRELENDLKRAESLVGAVLTAPANAVPYAVQSLAPLREHATAILRQRLDDADVDPTQRLRAAMALASLGQVQTELLVSGVKQAATGECANIVSALAHAKEESINVLRQQAADAAAAQDWRHTARLGIVALHLDDTSLAQQTCQLRPDPIQRTLFIEELPNWQPDAASLAQLALEIDDSSLRSAICLAVGSIAAGQVAVNTKQAWQPILSDWYQNKPDGATHSAAGWVLRQWKLELPMIATSQQPTQARDWHVNSVGMTLLKIPAGTFTRSESDSRRSGGQQVTLTRSFLLADREVSTGLFQQFMDDTAYPDDEKPKGWKGADARVSPTDQHPVQRVSWYDAVLFCNWLSQREGLPPCYERTGDKETFTLGSQKSEFEAWRLIPDACGYRLPTEAEWEYACRAGTVTAYGYGDDESLLDRYAVYLASRAEIPGSRLPNGWGLFDMHGNVWEWCHDWYDSYGNDRVEDPIGPAKGQNRLLRGGGWTNYAPYCPAAYRNLYWPSVRVSHYGFRVCMVCGGQDEQRKS